MNTNTDALQEAFENFARSENLPLNLDYSGEFYEFSDTCVSYDGFEAAWNHQQAIIDELEGNLLDAQTRQREMAT